MDLGGSKLGRILLSGGSGMLGRAIGEALRRSGGDVVRLTRKPAKEAGELSWDPSMGALDVAKLNGLVGLTAAVHLSGANVSSRRWTAAYKREIVESRVRTTQVLAAGLARMDQPPEVLVAASAVGIFGDRGDEILEEDSAAGRGFFPELCQAWEAATKPAEGAGIRVVHLRFGVVIGRGGAMAMMLPLFRMGLGGKLGSGRQWMSWVSERDVVAAALFALENHAVSGALNVTAPNPVTNAEFTSELARAVHRPAFLPAPAFALRLAFGEMADEALLASTRAVPKRLLDAGFVFALPTLATALTEAVESL